MDVRPAEATDLDQLAHVWHDGWHEAHAHLAPLELTQQRTYDSVRSRLEAMGYTLQLRDRTSGPINGIMFDREHGTMWGASSNFGEDYGIPW